MAGFDIDLTTDITDRLATWAEQFISETSFRRYQRACAFVMDETAKHVAVGMRQVLPSVLDRPTVWSQRAFQYRRALGKGRGVSAGVYSEFYVLPNQSVVFKYLMGMNQNVRLPGDVGLAQDRIYLPAYDNLAKTQGIRPNAQGNLPGGVMARLAREAEGNRNKRRKDDSGGVFKKEVTINGVTSMAYINRPKRTYTGETHTIHNRRNGRFYNVRKPTYTDRPRVLMFSVPKATYDPILQAPWDNQVREALDMIPERMASEMQGALARMAATGRR